MSRRLLTANPRSPRRLLRTALFASLALCAIGRAAAQNTPVISGAVGFLTERNEGSNDIQPVVAPLLAAPLGSRVLIESRADIRDFFSNDQGGFPSDFMASLQFLQADVIVNRHVTLVAGKYLLPFGTYNERLSTIWVPLLQDGPMLYGLGTRNSGDGNGFQLRGAAYQNAKWQLNYDGYFSARTTNQQFGAARLAGGQAMAFIPNKGLEVGFSYQRYLQQHHLNNYGIHVWWLPQNSAFQLRSEYAHDPTAQGYWIETTYRLSRFGGENSLVGRFQPVFRMQQTFRNHPNFPGQSDGLPGVDAQQLDFGFNYNLPNEVRLDSSYSRHFDSNKNFNIWALSLTYRFLFPAFPALRGKH